MGDDFKVAGALIVGDAPDATLRVLNLSEKAFRIHCGAEIGTMGQVPNCAKASTSTGTGSHVDTRHAKACWTTVYIASFIEMQNVARSATNDGQFGMGPSTIPKVVAKVTNTAPGDDLLGPLTGCLLYTSPSPRD